MTPWFVFMDMSFEKTFSQQREQLCTGHQKAEKEGETKNIMERTVESELEAMQHTWGSITKLAQDRQGLRKFFCCPTHHGV